MKLYTIYEVATMLSIHPRTVRRYIEKGQLRSERVGGSWRITEDAVKEMFNNTDTKDTVSNLLQERSDDMVNLYLQGKHRLQQTNNVVLLVFVFNSKEEVWVLAKIDIWMTELNRLGQNAQFDFTITGSEQGLYRLVLIAPFSVSKAMLQELESIRKSMK